VSTSLQRPAGGTAPCVGREYECFCRLFIRTFSHGIYIKLSQIPFALSGLYAYCTHPAHYTRVHMSLYLHEPGEAHVPLLHRSNKSTWCE